MTLPANIRINVKAPFPANVSGAGMVVLTKANGIWTVSIDFTKLGPLTTTNDIPGALVAVYDPVTKLYNTLTAAQIAALASTTGARTQRSITGGGQLPIIGADSILNVNNVADLTPTLPLASTRNGAPLTINNMPGSHTQTVGTTGADTIDGQPTVQVVAGARVTFWPYFDGVNAGYFIGP